VASVVIIGAGIGGLATAIRLAEAGHDVSVFEINDRVGGKLAGETVDGFHFDIGPSLLTMPQLFDELGVEFDRFRLAEPFRYNFADGSSLKINDDLASTSAAFESFQRGAGTNWLKLLEHGRQIWEVSERTFFAGPMSSPGQLLRRMQRPSDLMNIDPVRVLNGRSKKTFSDSRLQQWLNRYATYSGSSPYKVPATVSCIPYLEQRYGCWHVPGGLAGIAGVVEKRAREVGVSVSCLSPVDRITVSDDAVDGVRLQSGQLIRADAVVANVDAGIVYRNLLPLPHHRRRIGRTARSTAGFAMLLNVAGKTQGLRHHNVWFSSNYQREFHEIQRKGVAADPTIYVCCSSVTSSAEAPPDDENWFVLVNVKAGAQTDWSRYGRQIIKRLGIEDRVQHRVDLTPDFYARKYGSADGAIYGTSSNGRRAAFLRAANRGPMKGMYLVGGSAHPGGGLPLVLSSARIVSTMINEDFS
jgi:phytoene desaturase